MPPRPAPPTPQGASSFFVIGTVLALVVTEAVSFINGTIERTKGTAYMMGAFVGVLAGVGLLWLLVFIIARIFGKARTGAGKMQIAFWVTAVALLGQLAVLGTKKSGALLRNAVLTAVTDSERTGLVLDTSGISHPLFGFSLPHPGPDFLPDSAAQHQMDSLMEGERGLVAWVLRSASSGEVVIVQVTKGTRTDETTFRAFVRGVERTAGKGAGTQVLTDSVSWAAGTGEYLYAAHAANGAYVQIRCLPHTTGGTGLIVCITTGSTDPKGLDFVRNGLAFAGP
ncbi:MAG TPA: hypothetical protein VFP39_11205 [Gemmatimonadales bacterium]|nr:hypothetical protein [Gemmatimonadales bacterium]